MDFLKDILSKGNRSNSDEVATAITDGERMAKELFSTIMKHATPMVEAKNYMGAAVFIIATVWNLIGMAKEAMLKTAKAHGADNPISHTWEMFEATFGSENEKEALNRLDAIRKKLDL